MGVLKSEQFRKSNILTENGFEFEKSSITGALKNCYERVIPISDNYYMWVSVDIITSTVVIYVEYECGGEVDLSTYHLFNSFDNEEAFFEELDEDVTSYLEIYADRENDGLY